MKEEIWKDIPGYEGLYQVSSLGRVRSLDRVILRNDGKSRFFKGRTLKLSRGKNDYLTCNLCINSISRTHYVHQLTAMALLNHAPGGHSLVVDHINNVKTDNRLENLQLISQRHNLSKDKNGTSRYPGVSWYRRVKKWQAHIVINGKHAHLGYFTDESEAALAYQKALENHLESLKNC